MANDYFTDVSEKSKESSSLFELSRKNPGQDFLGDMRIGKNIFLDGRRKRLLMHDDDAIPKILLGFDENGF